MAKLLLLIALLAPGPGTLSVAAANDLPTVTRPKPIQPKSVQPKPKAPRAAANPCAQYGPGFVQVQGTTTCVRTNGYVRTDGAVQGQGR